MKIGDFVRPKRTNHPLRNNVGVVTKRTIGRLTQNADGSLDYVYIVNVACLGPNQCPCWYYETDFEVVKGRMVFFPD